MHTKNPKTEKARFLYQRDMCTRKPKTVPDKAREAFRRPAYEYPIVRKETISEC